MNIFYNFNRLRRNQNSISNTDISVSISQYL